jgi:hypothetical protein
MRSGWEPAFLAALARATRWWFGRLEVDLAEGVRVQVEVSLAIDHDGEISTPLPGWLDVARIQGVLEEFFRDLPGERPARVVVTMEARGPRHVRVIYGGGCGQPREGGK